MTCAACLKRRAALLRMIGVRTRTTTDTHQQQHHHQQQQTDSINKQRMLNDVRHAAAEAPQHRKQGTVGSEGLRRVRATVTLEYIWQHSFRPNIRQHLNADD
jgi:hypothetical protein